MVMFSWDQIEESSKDNSTKEYIENFLRNLQSEELVIAVTSEFVSSVSEEYKRNVGLRLNTFRILFSTLPTRIFSKFVVPTKVLEWLCGIIENSESHSPSVRGCAICVTGLIVRNFAQDGAFDYKRIARALGTGIRHAGTDLHQASSDVQCICGPGAILLHQIVNVLAVIADSTLPWLQPISEFLPDASAVLRRASTLDSVQSGKLHVDAAKVYSFLAEVWLENSSRTTDMSIIDIPACIFAMVSRGPVLHDSLLGAYQLSLEVNQKCQLPVEHISEEATTDRTTTTSEEQIRLHEQGDEVPPWRVAGSSAQWWVAAAKDRFQEIILGLVDEEDPAVATLQIKRIESLLGALSSWFDIHSNIDISVVDTVESGYWVEAADRALDLVEEVIKQLKSIIAKYPSSRSCRAAASDLRKGCIAFSHSVLTSCPLVVCDVSSSHSGEARCVAFSLSCLGTPLLFGAIHAALLGCGCLSNNSAPVDCSDSRAESLISSEESQEIEIKMTRHLSAGLRNTDRYSVAAAGDILTAIEELATARCVQLLKDDGDIPLLILRAFSSVPKGLKRTAPSVSKQREQNRAEDISNIGEWRTRCLAALQALFQLHITTVSSPSSLQFKFSDQFLEEFVAIACQNITLLRACLGIVPSTSPPLETHRETLSSVIDIYGAGDAEILFPVLQTLMSCLGEFVSLQFHSAVMSDALEISESNRQKLKLLACDICGTATRPLLFDDDCVLNCSEVELLTRITIFLTKESHLTHLDETDSFLSDVVAALRVGAGIGNVGREQSSKTFGTSSSFVHNESIVRASCLACLDMLEKSQIVALVK